MAALVRRGANVRHRSPAGHTALHLAALGGGPLVARILVAAGADPDVPNDQGDKPMGVARFIL